MSYFIIIRGPLGIGKSTIAKALAEILKAEYIAIDKVLEENGLDRKDNNYTSKDFIKVNDLVLPQVKEHLKKGKVVIFDGNFYFKEQIQHLEKNLPFEKFIFSLKADVETCIKRDCTRTRVYGEKAAREVHDLVSKFDYGVNVYTDEKTEDEVIKEILFLIKNS